jgi:hypothetical protein
MEKAEQITEMLYTFNTTHDAIAAEKALLDHGISVRVMPMPPQISAGCGIALRISREDAAAAQNAAGVPIQGIYKIQGTAYLPWNP